jgi:hypothetical protein
MVGADGVSTTSVHGCLEGADDRWGAVKMMDHLTIQTVTTHAEDGGWWMVIPVFLPIYP